MNFIYRLDQDPDRPAQVTYAILLLYAFLALQISLHLIQIIDFYIAYPERFALGSVLFQTIVYAIGYVLMFLVARKIADGRNWARWLLLIGFGLSVVTIVCNVQIILGGDALNGISSLSQIIVTALAATLLFQKSSSTWFKTGRRDEGQVDASIKSDSEGTYQDLLDGINDFTERAIRRYRTIFDSKPKLILGATLLYAVVGALACWGPFYVLIVSPESRYIGQRTSYGERVLPLAYGAILAAAISLPFTYLGGGRFSKTRALWIGMIILATSFLFSAIGGI